MPNDKTIKAVAKALHNHIYSDCEYKGIGIFGQRLWQDRARAAIIAFLRNCKVSEGMRLHGAHQKHLINSSPESVFKAMAEQLAAELEGE